MFHILRYKLNATRHASGNSRPASETKLWRLSGQRPRRRGRDDRDIQLKETFVSLYFIYYKLNTSRVTPEYWRPASKTKLGRLSGQRAKRGGRDNNGRQMTKQVENIYIDSLKANGGTHKVCANVGFLNPCTRSDERTT